MGKPYSLDLRKRVVSAIEGGMSRNQAAKQFGIAISTAIGWMQLADELHGLGYKLKAAKNLAPKHVNALVSSWKGAGIADATIRNRLGWLRWWAEKAGKPGMIGRDNEAFGLAERTRFNGNRAKPANDEALAKIHDVRVRVALKLEAAFGLRREEALKMRPMLADRGDRLALRASWCKGGGYREITLTHPKQRALLDEVKKLCGDGSLIGDGRSYRQAVKAYENQLMRAGVRNAHGYRHAYAQWRYKVLTGWDCPAAGGRTCERMSGEAQRRDYAARMQISHELGHGRIDVTDTYLGRREVRGGPPHDNPEDHNDQGGSLGLGCARSARAAGGGGLQDRGGV
jgi:integrase